MKITFSLDADSSVTTTPEKLSLVNLPDGKTLGIAFAGTVLLRYENVQAVPIPPAAKATEVPPAAEPAAPSSPQD
jgi:hypothetical protein